MSVSSPQIVGRKFRAHVCLRRTPENHFTYACNLRTLSAARITMKRMEARQSARHDVGHSGVTRGAWDWVTRGHSRALGALKSYRLQMRDVRRIDCDHAKHKKTWLAI